MLASATVKGRVISPPWLPCSAPEMRISKRCCFVPGLAPSTTLWSALISYWMGSLAVISAWALMPSRVMPVPPTPPPMAPLSVNVSVSAPSFSPSVFTSTEMVCAVSQFEVLKLSGLATVP